MLRFFMITLMIFAGYPAHADKQTLAEQIVALDYSYERLMEASLAGINSSIDQSIQDMVVKPLDGKVDKSCGFDDMISNIRKDSLNMAEDVFRKGLNLQPVTDAAKAAYLKHFTEVELKTILEFKQSGAGKKFSEVAPQIADEITRPVAQQIVIVNAEAAKQMLYIVEENFDKYYVAGGQCRSDATDGGEE